MVEKSKAMKHVLRNLCDSDARIRDLGRDANSRSDGVEKLRVPALGIFVSAVTIDELTSWMASKRQGVHIVSNHNLHSVYLRQREQALVRIENDSRFVLADGFPIWIATRVLVARRSGTRRRVQRIGSTDLILSRSFQSLSLRVAIVGAEKRSAYGARNRLQLLSPNSTFAAWDGFEDLTELRESSYRELHGFAPDVVLLGLGMPLQETVIVQDIESLPDAVYITVGGAIDQISGAQSLCPRWIGRVGLEWMWRLCADPPRLYSRYLIEPFKLFRLIILGRYRPEGARANSHEFE